MKKQNKNKLINFLLLISLFFCFNFSSGAVTSTASVDQELAKLKADIEQRQDKINELEKQRVTYEQSLRTKRLGVVNLKNQLGILEDNINKISLDINTNQLQIEQTNLEISDLELKINLKSKEVSRQQQRMSKIVQALEKNDRRKMQMLMVLVGGSFGEFFQEINQLQSIEGGLTKELKSLRQLKSQFEENQANLTEKKRRLGDLRNDLQNNQARLDQEKSGKTNLLTLTKGQEEKFQKLLAQTKAEQAAINNEIQNLAILMKKKLASKQGGFGPSDKGYIWPTASHKISTYFHDPDYPFRYVFEHPAIDIGSTPQGSPIRAAASGYVAKVKNSGMGYSYIMLVHNGGLATVYGHMSKMYVQEDTYVAQGEIIGLSGGMPGTPGAGNLTTGPHLHFEIRKDGIPVNPVDYLPN